MSGASRCTRLLSVPVGRSQVPRALLREAGPPLLSAANRMLQDHTPAAAPAPGPLRPSQLSNDEENGFIYPTFLSSRAGVVGGGQGVRSSRGPPAHPSLCARGPAAPLGLASHLHLPPSIQACFHQELRPRR